MIYMDINVYQRNSHVQTWSIDIVTIYIFIYIILEVECTERILHSRSHLVAVHHDNSPCELSDIILSQQTYL